MSQESSTREKTLEVIMSKEQEVEQEQDTDGGKGGISDFLQAPRRKRKNYVILALSEHVGFQMISGLEKYVRGKYKQLAVSKPKNPDELKRQFGRNINLLVIDDQFADLDLVIDSVKISQDETARRSNSCFVSNTQPGTAH